MKYRTIVADPPWDYSDGFIPSYTPSTGRVAVLPLPYAMMDVEDIARLPVADLADVDCRAFLWTTNRYLPDAFGVLTRWGFTYKQTLTWHKTGRVPPYGGSVAPQHSEFLIVGTRGHPPRLERWPTSVLAIPRLDHSRKPDRFLDLVESSSPGPYLEMFARRTRLGWDTWGDEALEHVQLA